MGMLEHIALVSQTNRVSLGSLSVVAAALQKQVSRDFKPYWGIDATVNAFDRLQDVPMGYWPIVIRNDIPIDAAGIHLNQANGQPFALVRYSTNWALTTSHELLEMLADPYGNRTTAGDSLAQGQGRVEYLVEVCDPSEAAKFGYTVNGVLLSDFYTTRFFDPVAAAGVRYSFSGAITQPRQVLDGGYISWYDPMSRHVFQLRVDAGGNEELLDLGALPGGFGALRLVSDRSSSKFRSQYMEENAGPKNANLLTAAAAPIGVSLADESTTAQAVTLQAQIDALVTG